MPRVKPVRASVRHLDPLTTARPPPPPVFLHGLIAPPVSRQLREALTQSGLQISARRAGSVRIVPLAEVQAQLADDPERPVVALFDGQLSSELAPLLRRPVPVFLLACRGPEGVPSPWELSALAGVLAGRPLLPAGATARAFPLKALADVRVASEQGAAHVKALGASKSATDITVDLIHEMGVNALLDAPVDAAGRPKYAHSRDQDVTLDPEDGCEVAIAVEDGRIYLTALDRFGRLTAEPMARVLDGYSERAKLNVSGGGAGLGFRRLVEQSDLLVVRVIPGRACQAVSVVDMGPSRRRANEAKSVIYYVDRG